MLILLGNYFLPLIVLFCQIETVNRMRKSSHQLSKMPFGRFVIGILFLLENNIWLRLERIGLLKPKKRNRSSDLDKRCELWLQIKMVTVDVANLLDLYKVGDISMLIDSSLKIPGSCIPSRSPGNENVSAVLSFTPEIQLTYISVHDRHHPFLFDEDSVEVFDQIVVPQEMTLEW